MKTKKVIGSLTVFLLVVFAFTTLEFIIHWISYTPNPENQKINPYLFSTFTSVSWVFFILYSLIAFFTAWYAALSVYHDK